MILLGNRVVLVLEIVRFVMKLLKDRFVFVLGAK